MAVEHAIQTKFDGTIEIKSLTPLGAIRAKCLDCSAWNATEVRLCPVDLCPIWPFRFGKNPGRAAQSSKQRMAAMENLKQTRDGKIPPSLRGVN